jgi:hypothetical protein
LLAKVVFWALLSSLMRASLSDRTVDGNGWKPVSNLGAAPDLRQPVLSRR